VVLNTLPLFLAGAIVLASRLDVALFFTGVVSGQILISLRIDRFGWFEIPMRSLTFERMLGAFPDDRRGTADSARERRGRVP